MQAWHVNLTGSERRPFRYGHQPGQRQRQQNYDADLLPLIQKNTVRIASIEGGNLRNAIPREAEAVICFSKDKYDAVKKEIDGVTAVVKAELGSVDPGLEVTLASCNAPETVMPACVILKAVRAIYAAPNGVWGMSASMPGLVETSSNLAIVSAKNGRITVHCLLRSLVDTAKKIWGQHCPVALKTPGQKHLSRALTRAGNPIWILPS
jgi:di/tripeptidase